MLALLRDKGVCVEVFVGTGGLGGHTVEHD